MGTCGQQEGLQNESLTRFVSECFEDGQRKIMSRREHRAERQREEKPTPYRSPSPRHCGVQFRWHFVQTRNVEGTLYGKASTIETSHRGWVSSSQPLPMKTHILLDSSLSSPSHMVPQDRTPYRPPNQTRGHGNPPSGGVPTPPPPPKSPTR